MATFGTIMVVSSFNYYNGEFSSAMETSFDDDGELMYELRKSVGSDDYAARMKEVLRAYSGTLGISNSRNYCILSANGEYLEGSDASMSGNIEITPNILKAMSGERGSDKGTGISFSDYAVKISGGGNECIVYVRDSHDDAKEFSGMIFKILMQTLLVGMIVAVVLSVILSKAIISPIKELTDIAQKITKGNYEERANIKANDEIGTLSDTINNMTEVIKDTIDEKTSERKNFESLFVYLNDPVIVFDKYGNMLNINRQARKLFHLSKEEVNSPNNKFTLPKMIRILGLSPEYVTKQHLENKDSVFHDIVVDDKVCDFKFTEFSYTKDKSNKGVMCVIHDNTERLALEKSRKEFVSDVSHELRTPLTAIKGFVETVVQHPELDDEIKDKFMSDVVVECDRMTRLVEDLLVLSRLDNNRTAWKIEKFEFPAFMEHLRDVMAVEAAKHEHTLVCECESGMEPMTADREKIQQVLVNIISNSIKYTPNGGRIEIKAKKATGGVTVCVADNGMGIPEDDIPRLFERFYRVEKARTTDSGGSGLGLAISKEIVDSHGGKIWVQSEVDKGTKMYVYLPYTSKLSLDNTNTIY